MWHLLSEPLKNVFWSWFIWSTTVSFLPCSKLISSHSALCPYTSSPTGLFPITGLGLMLYCHKKFSGICSSLYRKCSFLGLLIGWYFLIIYLSLP